MAERDRLVAARSKRLDGPDDLVESFPSAVQMIDAVVGRERVRLPVEREAAARDPIRVAPDDCAEVTRIPQVLVGRPVPEDDVGKAAGSIGRLQRRDDAAVLERRNLDAGRIAKSDALQTRAADASARTSPTEMSTGVINCARFAETQPAAALFAASAAARL